jgi:hypothetical protein
LIDVLRTFSHIRDGITRAELDLLGTGQQGIVSWLLRTTRKIMTSRAKFALIVAVATVILASPTLALTQQVSHLACPSGYSLIGEFCISDNTGDIVLPATYK